MKPGAGKRKGSSYERLICKQLSLWLSESKIEDVLWRSSMSGGRSTVAAANGKRLAAQAGDISSIHPLGHSFTEKYFIECKHYTCLDIPSLLTGKGRLCEFWDAAKVAAEYYHKRPLMIAKQNRLPAMLCAGADGLEELGLKDHCVITAPKQNLFIVLLDDFFIHGVRPNGTQ